MVHLNCKNSAQDAILNGVEVLKLSNSVNSLDGEFGVDGKEEKTSSGGGVHKGAVAAVGFGLMFGAFLGLGAMVYKWKKRPQDWQKRTASLPGYFLYTLETTALCQARPQWGRAYTLPLWASAGSSPLQSYRKLPTILTQVRSLALVDLAMCISV
ncbi:hypothetical protein M0R45_008300 [Rubus argutus]|uniref:Uncharacterized protein n=1 Tax=Rubus argutus TaxID=59490 RepID=A0AAW1Y0E1_RUBAR